MNDLTTGIGFALVAGVMLGLYALPQKYTQDFKEENTWGLFFMLTMFAVPLMATFGIMKNPIAIFSAISTDVLFIMIGASILWGIGVMMWGKAIHHIGVSLGFSLFIGTVILVGSLLPFFVDTVPQGNALIAIGLGLFFVLLGVIANGWAGILRERGVLTAQEGRNEEIAQTNQPEPERSSMSTGIAIAVVGGLLATGFSLANAVGRPPLHQASLAQGNPEWVTALAVMFPIFLSGGVIMAGYFAWQLSHKKSWSSFKTPHFNKNVLLIFIMALFHYAASAVFAYAAFKLGASGNTVGYAIFNTACVVTAIVSGIVSGEWQAATNKARNAMYLGLASMVLGILIISVGNTL